MSANAQSHRVTPDIVYVHSNLRLVDKLEEISYSETTVPWFEREFISDSDSDEDN